MTRTVGPRPRIWFRWEDFEGLGDEDIVVVKVRPTGNDEDYPDPFDIAVPVRWWMEQRYVRSESWTKHGGYSFPRPTRRLIEFIREPQDS